MNKFKVGDLVIGNKQADERYLITICGWIGKVMFVGYDGTTIEVRDFKDEKGIKYRVTSSHFDKYHPLAHWFMD